MVRDGIFADPPPPEEASSAAAEPAEPAQPVDGLDPVTHDTRTEEELAPFGLPPDDSSPELLALDIAPGLQRRQARLFQTEPYAPVGIRVGSMVVLPEIEISSFSDSNVLRSRRPRSDLALDLRPSLRAVSNWRRHAVELRARGGLSSYADFSSENERSYALEARARLDATRRTNVEVAIAHDLTQESRSSIDAVRTAGGRVDITSDRAAVALNHRFNRLSLQLRGALSDLTYGDAVDAVTGNRVSNRFRDLLVTEEAARATWEFKPTLLGFVETAINQREYRETDAAGVRRDSAGERYRLGIAFGSTGQRLRGEASVGYGVQRPDDPRLDMVDGALFDANVAWRMTALTTFLLSARTEIEETTVAGSAGALSRALAAEVRHTFRDHLIATAGLAHTVSDYAGAPIVERETAATLGLEYFVSRGASIFGRYRHEQLTSTEPGRGYSADEVRIGLRIRP